MHHFLRVLDILRTAFELVFEEPESGPKSMVVLEPRMYLPRISRYSTRHPLEDYS